ncbi:imm11 family protein [Enterobacterales bacterium AW_CKDN230030176-1A_HGKHYDSX7]
MAKNFILTISKDYPESYWLKMKMPSGGDRAMFKRGLVLEEEMELFFEAPKKASLSRLLSYDFFFSDGPNLISPRLYKLMEGEKISGVQFLDASLIFGEQSFVGYKVFNVVSVSRAMDLESSVSEPLIITMPNGPRWFRKVVLDDSLELSSDIVRAEEEMANIIVKERVKIIFERHSIRGLRFESSQI